MIMNEVAVQLMDSFSNPVLLQQSRLKLDIASINSSGFSSGMFVDNSDGSYTGHYLAEGIGTYQMCASFDSNHLPPCPFRVNVYSGKFKNRQLIVHSVYAFRFLSFFFVLKEYIQIITSRKSKHFSSYQSLTGEYFPRAYSDNISVWEDESIAFDALENDYFAGENASILNFSRV